jgi:hypothetical protein
MGRSQQRQYFSSLSPFRLLSSSSSRPVIVGHFFPHLLSTKEAWTISSKMASQGDKSFMGMPVRWFYVYPESF